MFFELANKPSTTFGVRPSGVLIMRKVWKPADAYIKAEWSSGPVPEPARCIYQCDLLSEPEISGNATGISRASGRSIPGYESILNKKCCGLQTDGYARQMNSGTLNYVSLEHNLSFLFWFWRPRIKDKDRSIRHKISRLTIFEILV